MSVEKRNIQVRGNALVSVGDTGTVDEWQKPGRSKHRDARPGQIFFRLLKFHGRLVSRAKTRYLGPVIESFHYKCIRSVRRALRQRLINELIVHLLARSQCPRQIGDRCLNRILRPKE